MIIKVNYTVSNPIIKITYDETPIYVSTTSNPIYVSVNYGGTSSGGSGTVTSVGLTMPSGFAVSGSPITTSGTIAVTGSGTTSEYVRGDGTLATFPTITSGTVTSVGLSMPSAFTVTSSPITTSGSISVTGSGTTSEYVRGDGTLATFPTFLSSDNLIKEVYNESGATMAKGTVVYINGSHGNLPTIAKALATGDSTSAQTLGMVQTDITNMNNGYIVIIGNLIDMDTQAFANGTQLYLSGVTAGGYTSTKQYAPVHLVYVGIVVRSHPTQGIISVKCQNGFEVDEIHNLSAQNPSNNDGIFYNTSTSIWENKSIATALGYTPVTSARTISTTSPLSGGGDLSANRTLSIVKATTSTDGYLSSTDWNTFNNKFNLPSLTSGSVLFSNGTTIAQDNANFFWDDTNNRLGIGTATPTHDLTIRSGGEIRGLGNLVVGSSSSSINFTANRIFLRTSDSSNAIGIFSNNNVLIQNGGTFTDAGYRLDVNGTARVSGALTVTGSTTAASALAQGIIATPTLVAAANSDVLVGLDINPTFTLGAFTPVTQIGYRGQVASGTGKWNLYMSGTANNYLAGNLLIGSTTDAGQKLQVTGTSSFTGNMLMTGTITAASGNARSLQISNTLVASANNDILSSIYINSTSTVGAFTGVTSFSIYANNKITTSDSTSGFSTTNASIGTSGGIYAAKLSQFGESIYLTNVYANNGGFSTGLVLTGSSSNGTITSVRGIVINVPNLTATSVSGTEVLGMQIAGGFTKGTSTTVTYAKLLDLTSITGGVNNTIINISNTTSTTQVTGNWSIYNASTYSSYLSGNLLIGTTTDAGYRLDVNGTARVSGDLTAVGSGTFQFPTAKTTGINSAGFLINTNDATNPQALVIAYNGNATNTNRRINIQTSESGVGNNGILSLQGNGGTMTVGATSILTTSSRFTVFGTTAKTSATESTIAFFGTSDASPYGLNINVVGDAINANRSVRLQTVEFGIANGGTLIMQASTGSVVIGTNTPNASAKLQVDSTTLGFLPPRMTTTQKNAIATPAAGLMVFDTTLVKLCVYNGTAWETITSV